MSLSAVNACLSTGRQHPPDHQWQGNKAIPGRATRPPTIGGTHKVTGQWRHFNHHQDKKVYHVVKYRYWDGHGWSDWYKDVSHKTGLGH